MLPRVNLFEERLSTGGHLFDECRALRITVPQPGLRNLRDGRLSRILLLQDLCDLFESLDARLLLSAQVLKWLGEDCVQFCALLAVFVSRCESFLELLLLLLVMFEAHFVEGGSLVGNFDLQLLDQLSHFGQLGVCLPVQADLLRLYSCLKLPKLPYLPIQVVEHEASEVDIRRLFLPLHFFWLLSSLLTKSTNCKLMQPTKHNERILTLLTSALPASYSTSRRTKKRA